MINAIMGKRRKNKQKVIVKWFQTLEARISWLVLSAINVVIVVPYKKLFPASVPKCQWCGHTEDLVEVNAIDYNQPSIPVCIDVPACTERYWSKDF